MKKGRKPLDKTIHFLNQSAGEESCNRNNCRDTELDSGANRIFTGTFVIQLLLLGGLSFFGGALITFLLKG